MQTELVIDSQKLVYMNQMPVWRRFSWPADTEAPGASLSWVSTRAGTRQYGDFPGRPGWIRLLDKAVVSAYPGTSSSWSLSWKAPDGLLLNYTLRTEAGKDRWRCWRCETLRYRRRYSACARLLNVFR